MAIPPITNTEQFIKMVEERPALWDKKTYDMYANKKIREKCWREIFECIYPEFRGWDKKKQGKGVLTIIKRWSRLRDTYIKSEKKRLYSKSTKLLGWPVKPYRYYKEMAFLKAVIRIHEPRNTEPSTTNADVNDLAGGDNSNSEWETAIDPCDKIDFNVHSIKIESYEKSGSERESDFSNESDGDSEFVPVQEKRLKTIDGNVQGTSTSTASSEERHMLFFKSIISSLEKLEENQILEFQIGVLKLIKHVKNTF